MGFQKAERKQAKIKLSLTGPSGSGKTYSALLIASGMGKKIGVVDTENRSASLYSKEFNFDVLEIDAPFTVDKYLEAMRLAVKEGYDVLVVDSLSHEWSGSGGLLEQKEALDARGKGNSYTNWASISKQHEKFLEEVIQLDIHLIGTMRSKQEYILQDEKGKQVPKKVGMAPIQREGAEYIFTLVLDMAMSHTADVSKDRTGLFDGKVFKPTKETGEALIKWLNEGAKAAPQPAQPEPPRAPDPAAPAWTPTKEHLAALQAALANNPLGWEPGHCTQYMAARFKKDRLGLLTKDEYDALLWAIGNMSWQEAKSALAPDATRTGDEKL